MIFQIYFDKRMKNIW